MSSCKRLLSAVGATLLLGALVTTASAGRLSSSSQTFRAPFAMARFSGGFGTAICNLTFEGSFHSRTIAKTAASLIGYVTRAAIGGCETGSATVLTATLPWHIRYGSFTGTLPNITAIATNIVGFAIQIREPVFGITCLGTSTTTEPLTANFVREEGGALRFIRLGGRFETNCGGEGAIEAQSTNVTVLGGATRVTVTLI
jgi:hypothetical protein